MNIIQQQDNAKNLSDQQLQNELLNPTGMLPGFLALTELNRRKQMRTAYEAQKGQPKQSMAEEFSQGLGGQAQAGSYPDAVRGAMQPPPTATPPLPPQGAMQQMPSSPMGEQPPQAFADGGPVEMAAKALGADGKPIEDTLSKSGLGVLSGIIGGKSVGDSIGDHFKNIGNMALVGPGLKLFGVKNLFADGGEVGGYSAMMTPTERLRRLAEMRMRSGPMTEGQYGIELEPQAPLTFRERYQRAMNVPSRDLAGIAAETIRNIQLPDARHTEYGPQEFDMDAAMRDMKNPLWRVSRGKSEVAKPGLQDYPPDANGFAPRSFDPPLSQEPPPVEGREFNPGLAQPPLPDFGGPNGQGIAGAVEGGPGGGVPGQSGGQRVSGGLPGGATGGVSGRAGGGGSRGGVGGALNIGGEGLADYINEVRALQAPDRFGEMEKRNEEDRAKLMAGVEGDKGMALLTAGLGIMGGESPFAAVNIGRGAQSGIKYWNDAQKELRLAETALRQAENQITVARANRDEKQLETGIKLYASAKEREQQALNRANSSGIAAAERQSRLELANREFEAKDKDRALIRERQEKEFESQNRNREETREQSRITEAGTLATRYDSQANALDMKVATLAANPLAASSPDTMAEINALKQQSQALRSQAAQAGDMHRNLVIDREVRSGRLTRVTSPEEASKLPKGTRIVTPDGQIRVVN